MNHVFICVLSLLLVILLSTSTYAAPVSSHIEQDDDYMYNRELIDSLADFTTQIQSWSLQKLFEALKANKEDINAAAFVQVLFDSQTQDATDQRAFENEGNGVLMAAFQSLPEKAQAQLIFSLGIPALLGLATSLLG